MNKIESLAFALAKTCGGFTPDSEAFRANNPGLLKDFKNTAVGVRGIRQFGSWQAGFKALCFDLELKCSGKSRAGLNHGHPLVSLFRVWEIKDGRSTVNWLRRALQDDSITEETPIGYFV